MKTKKTDKKLTARFLQVFRRVTGPKRILVLVFTGTFLIAMTILLLGNTMLPAAAPVKTSKYQEGMVADKDIIVEQGITYRDEEATRLKQEAALQLLPPVFSVHETITQQVMEEYQEFLSWYPENTDDSEDPEVFFLELQSKFPGLFLPEDMPSLLSCGKNRDLLLQIGEILEMTMVNGILAIPDSLDKETISIVRWRKGVKEREEIKIPHTVTLRNLQEAVISLAASLELSEEVQFCLGFLIPRFARENAFYDEELTELARQQALISIDPVVRKLSPGEVIVKKGFVITPEHMKKIEVLGSYSAKVNVNGILGTTVYLIILMILAVALYLPPLSRTIPETKIIIFIASTVLTYFVLNVLAQKIRFFPDYIPYTVLLPTALAAMLVSILHTPRAGIILSLLLGLSIFLFHREAPYPYLFTFLTGVSGTFAVMGAEKRITLVRAAFMLAGMNILIMVTLGFFLNYTPAMHLRAAGAALGNGLLCGILNIGLLPFFEHMMNIPTPFRLMDLSDLNTPLFKRMLILAPGTYSHSIFVANLAETACREIGANALLARVGAYYHDIGKIDQAEYFIENQVAGNKHDDLKPNLSTAVIKAHVKTGIEKGKDLGLPQAVIDIIGQHHGNGLISYFYIQAMKDQETKSMSTNDFSYNGTPPISKEAAVVMLADSVEAASRIIKKPTLAKLEKFVWNTIMEKITDRQMQNSELTFRDMEIISKTFVRILAGHFHSRIEYPDMNGSRT